MKLTGLFSSIEQKVLQPVKSAEAAVANVVDEAENAVGNTVDHFEGTVAKAASNVLSAVEGAFERDVDRPYATGRDGFVALDGQGHISGGEAAGVRVGDIDFPKSPLDSLLKLLGSGDARPVTFTLPGGQTYSSKTGDDGHQSLPLSELAQSPFTKGLDPKKGGIVKVGVSTPDGTGDTAKVLALPKGYDGPIFVCDIDDTLRATSDLDVLEGKQQPPIDGAKALLDSVAAKGIPIVYLSAGPDRIHGYNEQFLKQLPQGILLDRSQMSLTDLIPINSLQARDQGNYKAKVLAELKDTYPQAQLFGLGDDKYGDAEAYTQQNVTTYIHDVKPGDDNLPADFHGTLTKSYDASFISKVDGDLDAALARSASFGGTPRPADELAAISKELDQVSGSTATSGNVLDPFVDGQNALPQVLSSIDGAKSSIDYETFEFHDDVTGNEVADHLIAAAKRGVRVSVSVDAIGTRELPLMDNKVIDKMKAGGVNVRIYNPVDKLSDLYDFHLDHRKTIIVDGTSAFVGGMNTGDQYFGDPSVPGRYHDVFAKLTGPAVADMAKDFESSWTRDGGSPLPAPIADPPAPAPQKGGTTLRIVAHTEDDSNIRATYLTMIDHAQKEINVENGYPMSDDLVDALCAAAERGVNVRYIVGQDDGLIGIATAKNFPKLLAAGVHIYKYPKPIHTKALSVDGLVASVGSSNVDNVSLSRNREIVAVVQDPAWTRNFDAKVFDKDVVGSPDGAKTQEITRIDEPFFKEIFSKILTALWPDTFE